MTIVATSRERVKTSLNIGYSISYWKSVWKNKILIYHWNMIKYLVFKSRIIFFCEKFPRIYLLINFVYCIGSSWLLSVITIVRVLWDDDMSVCRLMCPYEGSSSICSFGMQVDMSLWGVIIRMQTPVVCRLICPYEGSSSVCNCFGMFLINPALQTLDFHFFPDRQAWANNVDPNQTLQNMVST